MYKIKTLNKISKFGLDRFDDKYTYGDNAENPDAILVRSASMLDTTLDESTVAIARAGAGVNNIPVEKYSDLGVAVFNTPGANANAVKELVIAGILLASRDVVGGINWVSSVAGTQGIAKAVEKEKAKFAGLEIKGKTLGVIGLGAIGGPLASAATHLGMDSIGHDPYMSFDAAWNIESRVKKVNSREEIFKNSDFISIHTPLIENADPNINTKYMINKDTIALMKDGVVILNFARDSLVNDDDIKCALESGKVKCYVTDFPNDKTAGMKGVIAIPHLGASTEESEDNCAVMAADEIIDYLENGNITNSVNLPNAFLPRTGNKRVCIIHKNVVAMLSKILTTVSECKVNVEDMVNKSKKDLAYTILDLPTATDTDVIAKKISEIDDIIKVRVI